MRSENGPNYADHVSLSQILFQDLFSQLNLQGLEILESISIHYLDRKLLKAAEFIYPSVFPAYLVEWAMPVTFDIAVLTSPFKRIHHQDVRTQLWT